MREHGVVQIADPGSDRTQQLRTLRCCHCGGHWVVVPGSGRKRGFCMRCGDVTCGPDCPAGQSCVPLEQFLENIEAGRPLDFRPTAVNVPQLWTPDST